MRTPLSGLRDQIPVPRFPVQEFPTPSGCLCSIAPCACFPKTFRWASPLRIPMPLLACIGHLELGRGSSRFCPPHHYWLSLAGTSSLLRAHLPPRTASFHLESPLLLHYPLGTIRGFPSYCKRPVNSAILKHPMGLIRYRALPYFAGLPTHWAESGSLALCAVHFLSLPSDPNLAVDALAIRIVFPLIGATPASFSGPGLFAPLGKQKKASREATPFLRNEPKTTF